MRYRLTWHNFSPGSWDDFAGLSLPLFAPLAARVVGRLVGTFP